MNKIFKYIIVIDCFLLLLLSLNIEYKYYINHIQPTNNDLFVIIFMSVVICTSIQVFYYGKNK